VELSLHTLLTLELDGSEWLASHPNGERASGTTLTGGWAQHCGEDKNLCPCWEVKPDSLVVKPTV
jgi:hypothetical protein